MSSKQWALGGLQTPEEALSTVRNGISGRIMHCHQVLWNEPVLALRLSAHFQCSHLCTCVGKYETIS